ncbi:glycosyltransferase family 2 protein [Caminibacter pacificus]|uniref:Cellulose synthase/poly-beta-1,6-N-acetylglucosamine synthase-like glycosyltransferase n=1 Tax=Caminibacter pacificus TaxID=1424653 RepID=A0AAJ4UXH5_9BACT|nr:glycosyltransferase [Caminibacter pacificus]QCI28879.1 glycosyltransferase family 2 protein [Caminibacter pacificus]ROR39470.1 cellulose synthase/poly-beta-1,6-N-acetylglucosamine synthase-like glycosyltransferase [Caminibacter pacificus]
MVKNILIIGFSLFLIVLLGFVLYSFYYNFYTINNIVVKIGVGVILVFTSLVILRYMLLLFFSILKTIFKTADEQHLERINKTLNHRVSIIVPAYNEEVVIGKSLESLVNQSYQNLEIIVVDDGSTDRTSEVAKYYEKHSKGKKVKVLRKPNGGKANAINFGIHHSTGELIMVVDADSKLEKDAVTLMERYFIDPNIAAVAGSVYVSNQTNLLTKLQALEYIEGLNMVRNGQALLKLVNIIPGPIGMFRKDALYEVGLYDSDTFAEDCDVTLKLITRGYKIDFESDAVAYTEAPEHLLDLIKQRYRWTRGILQAIKKHKGLLWNIRKNPAASFTMWYMLFESVFWPFMDVWTNMFIIYLSLFSGVSILIFYWWSIFTILDMAGALYCILITNEKLSLVFYAVFYRLFFITIINIAKIFSTIEEWFGIKMTWGKLERKGNL